MNPVNDIPKIIHYCWFGRKPLPELAKKCIASWRRFCPDYKIVEWNEDNYDLNVNDYVKEAYDAKKWAFVSDYARFDILYRYGGLYFDTDVELIKPIEDIVARGPFMGCENPHMQMLGNNAESTYEDKVTVAPGLGLAAPPGMELYREILDHYDKVHFINTEGIDTTTVVSRVTGILIRHGFREENKLQNIAGAYIYPCDYFCPMDYSTGELHITDRTRSIHHYSASWHTPLEKAMLAVRHKTTGKGRGFAFVGYIMVLPLRVANKISKILERYRVKSNGMEN